jgi:hypothetical protein
MVSVTALQPGDSVSTTCLGTVTDSYLEGSMGIDGNTVAATACDSTGNVYSATSYGVVIAARALSTLPEAGRVDRPTSPPRAAPQLT